MYALLTPKRCIEAKKGTSFANKRRKCNQFGSLEIESPFCCCRNCIADLLAKSYYEHLAQHYLFMVSGADAVFLVGWSLQELKQLMLLLLLLLLKLQHAPTKHINMSKHWRWTEKKNSNKKSEKSSTFRAYPNDSMCLTKCEICSFRQYTYRKCVPCMLWNWLCQCFGAWVRAWVWESS